jgi:HEAT repeat protein
MQPTLALLAFALSCAPATLLASSSEPWTLPVSQEKPAVQSAASLMEQGRFAEGQERDFVKAKKLYDQAQAAAAREGRLDMVTAAGEAAARAERRAAGIASGLPEEANDALTCRMAERLESLWRFGPDTEESKQAFSDIALLGALAVPWLEKAIAGPYVLCGRQLGESQAPYVRALALMSAPEGAAALERLLSSPDPLARRAVAEYAAADRHRAILMRALKDPAEAVRVQALESLTRSSDPALLGTVVEFAKGGTDAALNWLRAFRPGELLRLGASTELSPAVRREALRCFRDVQIFVPDAAAIDALLSIARESSDLELRVNAMDALVSGLNRKWRPVSAAISARVEAALLAAPDAFPSQYFLPALGVVGSSAALPLLVERTATVEDIGAAYGAVTRILGAAGPGDFPLVVAALGKSSTGQSPTEQIANQLRQWLGRACLDGVSSAQLAAGAEALPPAHRRAYVDRVAGEWLSACVERADAGGAVPKLDAASIQFLRTIIGERQDNLRAKAILALGLGGEASLIPELMGYHQGDELNDSVRSALAAITRNDPKRVETVLRALLSVRTLSRQSLQQACEQILKPLQPKELLLAVSACWKPAQAERLCALVARLVPGSEGTQFLLAHYKELDATAVEVRGQVIERFGRDLHEPALDVIGAALRDPSDNVRAKASQAFERFRNEQQRVREFEAWRSSELRAAQTIAELLPLLDNANPDVVIGAAKALGALKARACTPKLISLHEKFAENERVNSVLRQVVDQLAQ